MKRTTVMKLPREQKERLIAEVQRFFEEERSEAIGSIAAEALLEHMTALLGPLLYNHALADARRIVSERLAAVEDELYALERPPFASDR